MCPRTNTRYEDDRVPVIKTRSPDQMYAIGGKSVTITLENFGDANIVTASAAVLTCLRVCFTG